MSNDQLEPNHEQELDALLDELGRQPDGPPRVLLKEKIKEQIRVLRMCHEVAAYNRGKASQQALVDATTEQAESQQTSIIRATVAAVLEAVRDNDPVLFQLDSMHVKMNLEAQRTIWDRVELTTERDASQENVTFTIHKK